MSRVPYMIGITGPSCSGKTSIASLLADKLPGEAALLLLDSYYRDLSELDPEQRDQLNFDVPEALDYKLLAKHVQELALGRAIERPVYDFTLHARTPATEHLSAGEFVIVEGLFTLYWEGLRRHLDLSIFIDLSDDICLRRRVERDTRERGRTRSSVTSQYQRTVRPMYEKHVRPTKEYADIIINGEDPIETSISTILDHFAKEQGRAKRTRPPA